MNREHLIAAIRSDLVVGRGSCSFIDECWDDDDIWNNLNHLSSVRVAVRWARELHRVSDDRAEDIRNA